MTSDRWHLKTDTHWDIECIPCAGLFCICLVVKLFVLSNPVRWKLSDWKCNFRKHYTLKNYQLTEKLFYVFCYVKETYSDKAIGVLQKCFNWLPKVVKNNLEYQKFPAILTIFGPMEPNIVAQIM